MINGTIISCKKCGMEMRDTERCKQDMKIHKAECSGSDSPRERFSTGDIVILSAFGNRRLNCREPRVFEVISLNTGGTHTVRVRDMVLGTEKTFAHTYLAKVGKVRLDS